MKSRTKKLSRVTATLLETADDMHSVGILSDAAHSKITMRHLSKNGQARFPHTKPMTPGQIRKVRETAKMSQAVFAHHLNVTPGYISQLERGAKEPKGAALTLLNVIRRKGMGAIL